MKSVFQNYFYTKNIIFFLRSFRWLPITHFLFPFKPSSHDVLVCSGCYNKIPQTGWPINNRNLFFTVWWLEVWDQGATRLGTSSGSQFLVVSSHGGGERELSGASFTRALIPFMRAPPSWPNHLPKASPLKTITLGVRISTCEFCRGHRQSDVDFEIYCIFVCHSPPFFFINVFSDLIFQPRQQLQHLLPCFLWCWRLPACFPALLDLPISLLIFRFLLKTHFLLKVYSSCLQMISPSLVIIIMLPYPWACLYRCNETWTWSKHNACTWEKQLESSPISAVSYKYSQNSLPSSPSHVSVNKGEYAWKSPPFICRLRE